MTNSARKGRNGERDVRDLLTQFNIKNRLHGIYERNDLTVGDGWPVEVKIEGDGFKRFYSWLEDRKLLFTRADRKGWLVTGRAEDILPALADYFERAR